LWFCKRHLWLLRGIQESALQISLGELESRPHRPEQLVELRRHEVLLILGQRPVRGVREHSAIRARPSGFTPREGSTPCLPVQACAAGSEGAHEEDRALDLDGAVGGEEQVIQVPEQAVHGLQAVGRERKRREGSIMRCL
jgi:hypothetical protein